MTVLLAIAAGVVLAASAGLRAFVPLFAVGVASRTLGWDLASGMEWLAALALAVGAPIAGGVHFLAATRRVKSSVVSGGTLNPVASTVEDGPTVGAIVIAIVAPLLALALTIVLLVVIGRFIAKRRRRSPA